MVRGRGRLPGQPCGDTDPGSADIVEGDAYIAKASAVLTTAMH